MAKKLSCPKCDRKFNRPGHLARHLSATHGVKSKKKKKAKRRGPGRPPGSGKKRGRPAKAAGRRGRPSGLTSRLGLRDMTLQELGEVIEAAKAEARMKIAEMHDAF